MTEAGWRTLLQHLLSLRATTFDFIDRATCYKVSSISTYLGYHWILSRICLDISSILRISLDIIVIQDIFGYYHWISLRIIICTQDIIGQYQHTYVGYHWYTQDIYSILRILYTLRISLGIIWILLVYLGYHWYTQDIIGQDIGYYLYTQKNLIVYHQYRICLDTSSIHKISGYYWILLVYQQSIVQCTEYLHNE